MHMPPPIHGAAMMGKYVHDSSLVNESYECRYINPTTAANLEDIGEFGIRKILSLFGLIVKIFRIIISFKPKIVYYTPNSSGGAFYKDWVISLFVRFSLFVKWILGKKKSLMVYHYHNIGVSARQDKWLDNLLYKIFFHNAKVILLAEELYPDIEKYVRREDVQICPNGIPFLAGDCDVEKESIPCILFLSNMMKSKGALVLLDALKILKDRQIPFICKYVGGETREINAVQFAEEIRLRGLENNVTYMGARYGKEKVSVFQSADIFVLPSFMEAFPLTILEAMQFSLPVVASKIGGIPSIVHEGENGFLVNVADVQSLAVSLQKLILDEELRLKMGEIGRIFFVEGYTIEKFERKFVTCMDSFL